MDMLDMGLPQLTGGPKKGFEFRDVLSIGWRRKWLLIIPFIACFIGGLLICVFWTKYYASEAWLEFPRRALPGGTGMSYAEDFRSHQTRFRERAMELKLKVVNPKKLEAHLREIPNLIDPDKGPSLGYRLKVLFFGLEPEDDPGVTEQIDSIVSRIRVEIDERRPFVQISFEGTSRIQAERVCQMLVKRFGTEDSARLESLVKEKEAREGRFSTASWNLKKVEDALERYRVKAKIHLLPEYMPELREKRRNLRFDIRQLVNRATDLRTRLGVARVEWRTTSKEMPAVVEEGEKQDPDEEILAADRLEQVQNVLKNLERDYPPGHQYILDAKNIIKELKIKVQIEKRKISEISYKLPQLQKRHEELSAELQTLSEDMAQIFKERQDLIDEGKDEKSEEVIGLDRELLEQQEKYSKQNNDVREVAKELREYIRLQRLDAAGKAAESAVDSEMQLPEGEAGGETATGDLNVKNLEEELDKAIKTAGVNPDWIRSLSEVISLSRDIKNITDEAAQLREEEKKIDSDIHDAQVSEQEIRILEEKRARLVEKLEAAEKEYQIAVEELKASKDEYGDRMSVLVPPQTPLHPKSPNAHIVLIVSALAGLVVGSVLAVIAELTDHTLKKPKDLKNIIKQPVLAAIPSLGLPAGDRGTPQSLFYRTKREVEQDIERGALFEKEYLRDIRFRTIATEQMRKLRIAMLEGGIAGENHPRTILVSSALAGEGKSTVSANLAVAISQMIGEYVLLVDSDLRRPDLHNFFGMQPKPGLAEYLAEELDLADLLVRTEFEKLTLLQAGKVAANSTELLHSDKMRNLIKELKSRYSDRYIIIDSPPLLSTSEPDVLAEQVDGIVLVVRAGMTPREIVEDILSQLNPDKILGVVMNDVRAGISKYYVPKYSA